jgi:hypothetical protein
MDPLHPILPHHPQPSPIAPLARAERTDRDGRGGGGQGRDGRRKRRDGDEDAVEVDIEGVRPEEPTARLQAGDDPRPHIDLSA